MDILSRVMTSWGGMSNVTNLRLILRSLSIPGMMKIIPGPLAPISLPKRKITPRSYSRRILMAAAAMMMRKIIKKKIAGEIPPIRLSPFQIFYQYQDSSLSLDLLILNRNVNKNYRLLFELLYRGRSFKNHDFRKNSIRP